MENKAKYVYNKLKQRADKIVKENKPIGTSSFNDLAGNLMNTIFNYSQIPESKRVSLERLYLSSISTLSRYLRLISSNEDYARKETQLNLQERDESAFPDIRELSDEQLKKLGYTSTKQAYVALSEQRLRAHP